MCALVCLLVDSQRHYINLHNCKCINNIPLIHICIHTYIWVCLLKFNKSKHTHTHVHTGMYVCCSLWCILNAPLLHAICLQRYFPINAVKLISANEIISNLHLHNCKSIALLRDPLPPTCCNFAFLFVAIYALILH